jgi:hypothetical protein
MPDPITALVVGGTQVVGGMMQSKAASKAAGAQTQAAEMGIEEQRRQFNAVQELLKPYVSAGTTALGGFEPYQQAGAGAVPILQQYAAAGAPALEQQQALIGLRGPEAQQAAISAIERSPGFQSQVKLGEEALLQRASATGGLRGGNIQAALAQFRPQMLQREIETQYGRLGGLAGVGGTVAQQLANAGMGSTELLARLGQASATGTGVAAQTSGSNIANLMQQQGAAQAGAEMAKGQAMAGIFNLPAQFLGMQYGAKVGTPGFGSIFSDRRLKRNITKIGTRPDGLGVYEFEYVWGGGRQIGLMAQEVQEVYPDAVGEAGGYLTVNYSKV